MKISFSINIYQFHILSSYRFYYFQYLQIFLKIGIEIEIIMSIAPFLDQSQEQFCHVC